MKRQTILLLLSVLLLSGGAAAQSTKEQTLEDLNRTAALYYCYENHPRAAATPAPEGYEPFYISHYGRHGSRWHASESVYENPRAKLRKAAEAGKLTPLGEEALRRIEVVADDARHRYGDLSPRGVREHRGIAERMYCSFPEIFSTADGRLCRIRARSTLVPRCMLSMAAANERLKELNPAIDITREASKRYLDYMFRMTEANKIKKEIKQRIAELREREIDPSRFVRALVTDPSLVGNRKEQLRFMNDLYCVASVMQDVDYLDCSFYDLFTPDELYAFYAVRNYQMYLEEGPSAEFGHRALSDAVPLLRNFVAEADEAIATGALSASLRYGHDVNVIPLVGLMGIEGCDTRESDYRKVYLPERAQIVFGDVVATGTSLHHALKLIVRSAEETGAQITRFVFFTYGGVRAEEILSDIAALCRERFDSFTGVDLFYLEGRFTVPTPATPLTIKLTGTDLVRYGALMAPEFMDSQYGSPLYPLERCIIYDAGSRAFHPAEYVADVEEYWRTVLKQAQQGRSFRSILAERFPEIDAARFGEVDLREIVLSHLLEIEKILG